MSSGAISCHDPFLDVFSQLPHHHGENEQLCCGIPSHHDGWTLQKPRAEVSFLLFKLVLSDI